MKIYGIEKFSMVDYPGKICCTVFTGGCNFRCPFCHNGQLVFTAGVSPIDDEEVFGYLKKRKGLVDAVSVTGGEATLSSGLEEFLRRARELGYLTKLDTNGTRPDVLSNLLSLGLLDYVAMDVKNSREKYALTTGLQSVDMAKIDESVQIIKNCGTDGEFRTTLVRELHTEEDMLGIAEWLSGAGKYFVQKYVDADGCISHGFNPVPKETAEKFLTLFSGKVSVTGMRGYN